MSLEERKRCARAGAGKKVDVTPKRTVKERLRSFVADGPLDLVAGAVVLINAAFLIIEHQNRGEVAEKVLFSYPVSPEDVDRPRLFEIMEYVFLAFYVCETLLRMVVLRTMWYYTAEGGIMWGNFFDALIVAFGVSDVLIQKVMLPQEGQTHFGAVLLRLLKVMKVAKTMRLIRVMQLFSQLRSMVDTFLASLSSLFWSMVMLLVCMMIAALVLCESCVPYIVDPTADIEMSTREWLLIRYGSFTRAMYTMFEITFSGGWPGLIRPLVDEVSVLFAIPCLIYVVAIVFAALRLITALFALRQRQVLNSDAAAAVLERMERASELQGKLLEVFAHADVDGDGYLTLQEFEALLQQSEILHYLSVLELDIRDARVLFHILADGDETLSVEEFCGGIAKVRGNAKSVDIVQLMHETGKLRKECRAMLEAFGAQVLS
ncbi:Scn10a [Symbiodinium natans]|uniref:Scn10a protein n=1 Tax=Symbiodinium natans TaxID=878477 RepID=A0A812K0W5_9DINO|nr:Scn10a [Symbiodinium natans]